MEKKGSDGLVLLIVMRGLPGKESVNALSERGDCFWDAHP